MNQNMTIGSGYYGVIKRALDTLQVKAALDGKPDIVVATQDALDALKAGRDHPTPREPDRVVEPVKSLTDTPPNDGLRRVQCELTVGELIDMRIGLDAFMNDPRNAVDDGWRQLRARLVTTIELNTVRKS